MPLADLRVGTSGGREMSGWDAVDVGGDEAAGDQHEGVVAERQRREDVIAEDAALAPVVKQKLTLPVKAALHLDAPVAISRGFEAAQGPDIERFRCDCGRGIALFQQAFFVLGPLKLPKAQGEKARHCGQQNRREQKVGKRRSPLALLGWARSFFH